MFFCFKKITVFLKEKSPYVPFLLQESYVNFVHRDAEVDVGIDVSCADSINLLTIHHISNLESLRERELPQAVMITVTSIDKLSKRLQLNC